MNPEFKSKEEISSGMVGYFLTNMKNARDVRIGDSFHFPNEPQEALPGF